MGGDHLSIPVSGSKRPVRSEFLPVVGIWPHYLVERVENFHVVPFDSANSQPTRPDLWVTARAPPADLGTVTAPKHVRVHMPAPDLEFGAGGRIAIFAGVLYTH